MLACVRNPSVVRERLLLAALFTAVGLSGGGCEQPGAPGVDGGIGRRLEIVQTEGGQAAQLGLRYGQSANLVVRYVLEGPAETPVRGEPVRFALFDDPAGSTLARDVVDTDDDGLSGVTLTAGRQEGSFRVRASAAGANDVEFSVSVSMLEFVKVTASIVDPLPGAGTHKLTAALYSDQHCSDVPPTAKLTGAPRVLSIDAAASGALDFVNLLSRDYAVVARVTAGDTLLAYGCVDLGQHLASPGAVLLVPVGVTAVTPSLVGAFSLSSQLGSSRDARSDALWGDVNVVDRCPGHAAQLLLDEISARASVARAALIEGQRGAGTATPFGASSISCRPAMAGAAISLDADLSALLEGTATGMMRDALVHDLDELLARGELTSRLTISPTEPFPADGAASPTRLVADHEAQQVTLHISTTSHTYDLAALGWPDAKTTGIAASALAGKLGIDRHAVGVQLPKLWGLGFATLAVAPRLPSLMNASWTGWLDDTVATAQRNGKLGCAAVENLLCERTGVAGCAGTLLAPCTDAVASTGARLDAPFAQQPWLTLVGTAIVVDDSSDLLADRLAFGSWNATGPVESSLSFSAQRIAP